MSQWGPYLGGYLGEDKPGDRASSHISPTIFTKIMRSFLLLVQLVEE